MLGKDLASPWEAQKEQGPAHAVSLARGGPRQASDLQNSKIIRLCCFKAAGLGWLVSAASEN